MIRISVVRKFHFTKIIWLEFEELLLSRANSVLCLKGLAGSFLLFAFISLISLRKLYKVCYCDLVVDRRWGVAGGGRTRHACRGIRELYRNGIVLFYSEISCVRDSQPVTI